jgi:membrane-associated HD superfamily phosphohydrolase
MKALLPVYCRPLGYVLLAFCVFAPFLMAMTGHITNSNLTFYKECFKLLMMVGALMILFAYNRNESKSTEQIRCNSTRVAMFVTLFYVFAMMIYHISSGDSISADSTSFIVFLIIDVICYEFYLKKAKVENSFKR